MSASNPSSSKLTLSHNKKRLFKPEKLTAPRNFTIPNFVSNRLKTDAVVKPATINNVNHAIKLDDYSRPLIVEIGAGKGMHACLYAKKYPKHDLIAIERTENKFSAFSNMMQSVNNEVARLDNLVAVHADAIPYCVYAIPAQSVSVFYLLYPNPEPKNSNQQWLNMPFFEFLLSRLKPNGKVILASNINEYVDNGKVILASNINEYVDNAYHQSIDTWCLKTKRAEVPLESKRTHFEIKYLARGETCWQLDMIKPAKYHTRFDTWNSSFILENVDNNT
ncbi:methyltransferase [Psychrobacter sp.]|uniref:methyltransferase n=1 Tax=Psychrobacter sp. TaxID=56811 RepID=UPI0025D55995|nr:methyltransferase [Psychrobacter sp.]